MRFGPAVFALSCLVLASCSGPDNLVSPNPSTTDEGVPPPQFMTWEGCQITPGCSGEGGEGEVIASEVINRHFNYSNGDITSVPDPSPGADGIWLGITQEGCYKTHALVPSRLVDRDNDGLDDGCEYILAKAFAPMFSMPPGEECAEGEPYWAAKFFDTLMPFNTGYFVRIAYLPSYYSDCGELGHAGDSEFIQLTLAYNAVTKHWVLINSWLSAHATNDFWNYVLGPAGSNSSTWGPNFEWPSGRAKSWPRVYVSPNKHANYRSESDCQGGGAVFGWFESCAWTQDAGRMRIWEDHNIGSAHRPIRDCVQSLVLTNGVVECFWSGTSFGGWSQNQGPGYEEATAYNLFLVSPVWACYMYGYEKYWCSSWGI